MSPSFSFLLRICYFKMLSFCARRYAEERTKIEDMYFESISNTCISFFK